MFTYVSFEHDNSPLLIKTIYIALSGYNGAYNYGDAEIDARNAEYGPRDDGNPYVNPVNVCPARIYVGMKGKMEDGKCGI